MKNISKNTIFAFLNICIFASFLASCSDFTDLQPKGKNLLASTDDLNLLLNGLNNGDYPNDNAIETTGLGSLAGDYIAAYDNVGSVIAAEPRKKNAYIFAFFDSADDLARYESLTTADDYYTACYNQIGRIANPVLSQIDAATGDEATKKNLKAEALTIRAYCHFMAVQKFAKAYNPATAANDGGIVYLKETDDIAETQPKQSVEDVYKMCLEDINAAIELNALPSKASTLTRFNKASAYAVKAHILMSMKDYSGAEEAAKAALAENGELYDFWANATQSPTYDTLYGYDAMYGITEDPYWSSAIDVFSNPETYEANPGYMSYQWVKPEAWDGIEEGYSTKELCGEMQNQYGSILYNMYAQMGYLNDLAEDGWHMASDYNNNINTSGLCSPEMYLFCAECEVRNGNIDAGMNYLDQLRKYRVNPEVYQPFEGAVTTKAEAIEKVKATVFAENLWNGWNYFFRKRWNVDSDWETTITRTIGGTTYTLKPDSKLWIYPIPQTVRNTNANMTTNWD